MADTLALDLEQAVARLARDSDRRFAQSLLDRHTSGKPLSANQMYWAKELIERSGRSAPSTEFGGTTETISEDLWAGEATPAPAVAAPALAGHSTWKGGWSFGDHALHVRTQRERLVNAMSCSELLLVPPIYGTDPLASDPLGWIERELKRLTGQGEEVGSEQWNEERDYA